MSYREEDDSGWLTFTFGRVAKWILIAFTLGNMNMAVLFAIGLYTEWYSIILTRIVSFFFIENWWIPAIFLPLISLVGYLTLRSWLKKRKIAKLNAKVQRLEVKERTKS